MKMIKLLTWLLVFSSLFVPARAQMTNQTIDAFIGVTTNPTGTNGEYINFQNNIYIWTNQTPLYGQIQVGASSAISATNLFNQLTQYFSTTLRLGWSNSTTIRVATYLNGGLTITNSGGWSSLVWTTNVIGGTNTALNVGGSTAGFVQTNDTTWFDAKGAAKNATNILGTAAWQNISAFDATGAGATAAQNATSTLAGVVATMTPTNNSVWFDPEGAAQNSTNPLGTAAFQPISAFDASGLAAAATNNAAIIRNNQAAAASISIAGSSASAGVATNTPVQANGVGSGNIVPTNAVNSPIITSGPLALNYNFTNVFLTGGVSGESGAYTEYTNVQAANVGYAYYTNTANNIWSLLFTNRALDSTTGKPSFGIVISNGVYICTNYFNHYVSLSALVGIGTNNYQGFVFSPIVGFPTPTFYASTNSTYTNNVFFLTGTNGNNDSSSLSGLFNNPINVISPQGVRVAWSGNGPTAVQTNGTFANGSLYAPGFITIADLEDYAGNQPIGDLGISSVLNVQNDTTYGQVAIRGPFYYTVFEWLSVDVPYANRLATTNADFPAPGGDTLYSIQSGGQQVFNYSYDTNFSTQIGAPPPFPQSVFVTQTYTGNFGAGSWTTNGVFGIGWTNNTFYFGPVVNPVYSSSSTYAGWSGTITTGITTSNGVVTYAGKGSGLTAIPVSGLNLSANSHIPAAVTVGASVFNFTNKASVPLECYFSGNGTAYSISKLGTTVYGSLNTDDYLLLAPNDYIAVTWSVAAPTFNTNALW